MKQLIKTSLILIASLISYGVQAQDQTLTVRKTPTGTVYGVNPSAQRDTLPTARLTGITNGMGLIYNSTTKKFHATTLGISNIAGLQTAIDLKANLASPTFTGTPAAPTATAGTNTTQIATTAFVTNGIATAGAAFVTLATAQNVDAVKTFRRSQILTGLAKWYLGNGDTTVNGFLTGGSSSSGGIFIGSRGVNRLVITGNTSDNSIFPLISGEYTLGRNDLPFDSLFVNTTKISGNSAILGNLSVTGTTSFTGATSGTELKIGTGTADSKVNIFTNGVYGIRFGFAGGSLNFIDGNTTFRSDAGVTRLVLGTDATFSVPLAISTTPTTSAGTYDILTRNTSTGVVEKIASSAATSWTYTPTVTDPVNISASSPAEFTYLRIGSIVSVSGSATITVTAGSTITTFEIDLPVASNFTTTGQAHGSGSSTVATSTGLIVRSNSTTDKATIQFISGSTGSQIVYFEFQYRII